MSHITTACQDRQSKTISTRSSQYHSNFSPYQLQNVYSSCLQASTTTFLSLMDDFLSSLPQIVPTIILGDFNDDLLSTSNSSALLQLMSSQQFSQLVQVPSTDSVSLLDHIYCNSVGEDIYYVDVVLFRS